MQENNFKDYVGVKLIKAYPATLFEFRTIKGVPTGEDHKTQEGYIVKYTDEYQSWSPKEVFEAAYLELKDPTRISFEEVEGFIKEVNVYTKDVFGKPTTHVEVLLLNDYVITEQSTCVDPANYKEELGVESCMERIHSKIWDLLGFTLAIGRFGIKK